MHQSTIDQLAVHVGSGVTPRGGSESYSNDGVIFIRSQNVRSEGLDLHDVAYIDLKTHESMRRSEVFAGDVLLNITGASIGRCCVVPAGIGAANVNQHVCAIRLPSPTEPDASFLAHVLASHIGQSQIDRLNAGGNREGLNYQQLRAFTVPWPSAAERVWIAAVLDTIDDAIQKTEQIIAKLQQVKQGLLHDLLTRGIDDNGELRDPERHPEQFQDSPLGRIPKGWEVGTVAHWFEVTSGVTLGPHRIPRYNPKPYLRVANVQRSMLDLSEIAFLEARDAEISNKLLAVGDLLIVEGHADPREIGRCAIVPPEATDFTFQNHLFRLRSRSALPSYALLQLNSASTRRYWWRTCATSSGLHTINRAQLARLKIAMASTHEQAAICSLADTTDLRILEEERAVGVLRAIRSGLAEDLLYGRVRTTSLPEFSA